MCDVKMNKRMFTKKFFSLEFLEKIHSKVNKFFFEIFFCQTSLFKKKMLVQISHFNEQIYGGYQGHISFINSLKRSADNSFRP